MMINLQNSTNKNGDNLPGSHWLSIGKENNQDWYFDSFGLVPPPIIDYQLPDNILYNNRQVQGNTSTRCGWFAIGCVLFMKQLEGSPEQKMTTYINSFIAPILTDNDKILMTYF